ncbi:hypothetical protein [Symbiopectobacterium purcellii]|uniref:hypothetical protein n=1 Tax=Symbiopectobacterium purcellii TaxID=2871826 RepID=UPI003F862601
MTINSERNEISNDISIPIKDPLFATGAIIQCFLKLIPEVGAMLATVFSLFWPKQSEDVWSKIKEQVKYLIDEEIDKKN